MDPPYPYDPAEKYIDGLLLGTLFLQTHRHHTDGTLGTGLLRATLGLPRILELTMPRWGQNTEKTECIREITRTFPLAAVGSRMVFKSGLAPLQPTITLGIIEQFEMHSVSQPAGRCAETETHRENTTVNAFST